MKTITGAVGANVISMVMSGIMTLIVPKFVGVEEYSYWQLHVFYGLYMSYTALGWSEGLYLRLGGADYQTLDRKEMASQFWLCLLYQTIINLMIMGLSMLFVKNEVKIYIITITAFSTVIGTMRLNLQMILQATGRIKTYVRSILVENIVLFAAVIIMIAMQNLTYQKMIFANVSSRIVCLVFLMFCCKEIVFSRLLRFLDACKMALRQIVDGIQLFLANISNSLIIGISRFMIEQHWGTVAFGEVSLVLTMSNLIVNCVNAISIVLFPILRREDSKRLPEMYVILSNALMVVVLGTLCFYYPAYSILRHWLPQYKEALQYFVLLLPICVYDSKTTLLVNTYLKTIRKEGIILLTNIVAIGVNTVLCLIGMYGIKKIEFVILGIIIALMIRCNLSEALLKKIMHIEGRGDMLLVLALVGIFIVSGVLLNNWLSMVVYIICYVVYLVIKRKDIQMILQIVKRTRG